jgi:segregation and condensation protein A
MSETSEGAMLALAESGAADADGRNQFVLDISGYEGPLHLLLELARRQKVDLAKVSILDLANQYLAYVRDAEDRRMDLAADYLLMAAWLAYLKSKLLLPSEKPDEDEVDGETMAGRLAFRLKRLEAMRHAVEDLYRGDIDGRDVFKRGAPQKAKVVRTPVWTTTLHDVLTAFGDINGRKYKVRAHVIRRQPVLPLESARRRLAALVKDMDEWCAVQSLPAGGDAQDAPRRSVVASYFSAALELARDRAVDLRQDRPFSDLYVRRAGVKQAVE